MVKQKFLLAGILLSLAASLVSAFPVTLSMASPPKAAVDCLEPSKLVQADAVARTALEAKDYAKVVSTYDPFCGYGLSAPALYRLAIAYQKLGNMPSAKESLDHALSLNPNGTFASSPQRLEALRRDIGHVAVAAVVATAPEPTKEEAVTPPVTPPIAVPELSSVAQVAPAVPAPELATELKTANQEKLSSWDQWLTNATRMSVESANTLLFLMIILVFLFVMLVVSFFQKTGFFSPNRNTRGDAALSQLRQLRTAGDELLTNLAAAGQQDTDLYVHLVRLLPHVERELGRGEKVKVRLSEKDKEDLARFSKVPLKLSSASPEQITELFQARKT